MKARVIRRIQGRHSLAVHGGTAEGSSPSQRGESPAPGRAPPFVPLNSPYFDLGPDQWLLFWHMRPYAPSHRKRHVKGPVQLPLLEVPP